MKIRSFALILIAVMFCGTNVSYAHHDGTNGESVVSEGAGGR